MKKDKLVTNKLMVRHHDWRTIYYGSNYVLPLKDPR